MSYREVRNFTEMMRVLGYPRLISVENFRTPNFELVAELLYWMVYRYDPEITVHAGIESEDDRVEFLTGIARAMAKRANIQLITKKLYAADGYAVKELLKIATLLYRAHRVGDEDETSTSIPERNLNDIRMSLNSRIQDAKQARLLASEITDRGAKLHDLLKIETDTNKKARTAALKFINALSSNLENGPEHQHIEKSTSRIIETTRDDVEKLTKQCANLESDEKALKQNIQKKKTDLERSKKRLSSLQNIRPAFMDEYERTEVELQKQYEIYIERFRNLDYLENELDILKRAENEKLEEEERALKRMQRKLQEEDLRILRGEGDLIVDDEKSDGNRQNHAASADLRGKIRSKSPNRMKTTKDHSPERLSEQISDKESASDDTSETDSSSDQESPPRNIGQESPSRTADQETPDDSSISSSDTSGLLDGESSSGEIPSGSDEGSDIDFGSDDSDDNF